MDFMLYNNPCQAFQCKVKHKQMLKTFNLLNLPAERNPAVKNVQVKILCLGWSSHFFVTYPEQKQTSHSSYISLSFIYFTILGIEWSRVASKSNTPKEATRKREILEQRRKGKISKNL